MRNPNVGLYILWWDLNNKPHHLHCPENDEETYLMVREIMAKTVSTGRAVKVQLMLCKTGEDGHSREQHILHTWQCPNYDEN